jgi:hypothetical protein
MRSVNFRLIGRAILLGLPFFLLMGLITSSSILKVEGVVLREGDVSPMDFKAPFDKKYESQILTEMARAEAEAAVEEIYDPPDSSIARRQVNRARQILDYIDSVRKDAFSTPSEKRKKIEAIQDLSLPADAISITLSLSEEEWKEVIDEAIHVIDRAMRAEIREGELEKAKRMLPTLMGFGLSDAQAELVIEIAEDLIRPNAFYNEEKTAEAKRIARDSVEPIFRTVVEGEIILREGEIITPLHLEALDALGMRKPKVKWQDVAGILVFTSLLTISLLIYLLRFRRETLESTRHTLLLLLLLVLFLLLAKFMVTEHPVLPYLLPIAAFSMLLTVLFDPQIAFLVTALLCLVVGYLAKGELELVSYGFFGGIVASFSLKRIRRLNAFFLAGAFLTLVNLACILAFRLPGWKYDAVELMMLAAASIANGGLSASLALAGFFALGSAFDITTSLQLLELARPTHPLLHRLLMKAPGTYHHSILVGNMAEQAAERIGADALLARVGAFYHDIGKIMRPYFFVENQMEGVNLHESLDPKTSAKIIIGHVREGLVLAKKYRLPSKIRDFIAQHQGTGLANYFYKKASQKGDSEVREEDFRYPGPKPRTKETAIVMLADACEASVRASRPSSPEEVERLVKKAIEEDLLAGELDECDLTLQDLKEIRVTFVNVLEGVFHPRVKYDEGRD